MRALRMLPAATLALLAAVAAAQAQRVSPTISPSMSGPSVSGGGSFVPLNRSPAFLFNPKEMTLEKGKPWTDKNKRKKHPGSGSIHCQPPNC